MNFVFKGTACMLAVLAMSGAAHACADREAAVAAIEAEDFDTAVALQKNISVDPQCDDELRIWLDERLARHFFAQAVAAPGAQSKAALFQASINYYPHWRSYVALADLARDEKDRQEEARLLQAAINQMNDGPEHHRFSNEEAQTIIDRAADAMLLAGAVVEPPRTRSGTPGGIFIEELRGYKVKEVELAIEFEFDSTIFTAKGAGYAQKLLDYLIERTPPKIVLEGHTDPVGTDAYNQALSLRRAESLRTYLIENGYVGQVDIVGRGETDVPLPPQGIVADSPEHHQIARRVVLIR